MQRRLVIFPDPQPAEVVQPRQRSLHDPANLAEAAAMRRPPACDPRPDAPPSQPRPMRVRVEWGRFPKSGDDPRISVA